MINEKLEKNYYPAWAEINLFNIKFNFLQLKKMVGNKVKMLIAVKAEAYGHGMLEVSEQLADGGVDYLGVASINEALILRKGKIKIPILVMGNVYDKNQIKQAAMAGISLTISDLAGARNINKNVKGLKKTKVHINIDTGMGRIGIWYETAFADILKICKMNNLDIEGIFTHFPSADTDIKFTQKQISLFKEIINKLRKNGINIPFIHAANSSAIFNLKKEDRELFNMIRPGLMIYGMYPCPEIKKRSRLKFRPVLELKSRIVFLKTADKGRTISYGSVYKVRKKTRIATISIGYADGYVRTLSDKANVLIKGDLYPVVGRVCMDQLMVDIGLSANIKVGDVVTLIGSQGNKIISAETLASFCDTIPYEITCGISARVKRTFKKH